MRYSIGRSWELSMLYRIMTKSENKMKRKHTFYFLTFLLYIFFKTDIELKVSTVAKCSKKRCGNCGVQKAYEKYDFYSSKTEEG